ncbi:hypothetical protein PTSG_12208 [Salpingoeca rosetta]|uniref:PDZ domain-containing protein n=1 Tax=Salpingoeca rosetta (strain ATCC 50818 / BSB-021) TaxID=946362 RepID=F2U9K0_SALR5|nr:uncharacterized protein PTSG_12208 [Salpingoeca rosetta]EGD73027.1 hypothetical protein PTSG_12208 [Salpingoeca rosetta]|eukprot:XP_004994058.1 hypothetical protein PTSG_12208 [Salpingoeca rosetta]
MYVYVGVFLLGLVLGSGGVLLVAFHLYKRWMAMQEKVTLKEQAYVEPRPSTGTREFLEKHPYHHAHQNDTMQPESVECLNVLFDFLFFQLRDTIRVRRHVLKLIDRNLAFLMNKSSLGNICKRMKVIDVKLGSEMPHLSDVKIVRPAVGAIGSSDVLDLDATLLYKGKFNVRIEADVIFQRKATLSITIVELRGRARFSFRSEPHPHWTFGFLEQGDEPHIDLEVEALIDNHLFRQLGSMVIYQIRAALRKVHTIPAPSDDDDDHGPPKQKMRYDPFFTRPLALADTARRLHIDNQDIFTGRLTVEVIGCRHLQNTRPDRSIFVTLSLYAHTHDEEHDIEGAHEREFEVYKAGAGATIGIAFDQADPIITAIKPGTPASGSGLCEGDVVTAVNNISVIKSKQALKLIKESGVKVRLQVIRKQKKTGRTNRRDKRGRYSETRIMPPSPNPTFREVHTFLVTPSTPQLYIHVYDCKLNKQKHARKKYLLGFAALDLEETALFCVANQSKLLKLKRLQTAQLEGAPPAGFIKLLLQHTPTPVPKDEAAPYPSLSRRPRATSVTDAEGGLVSVQWSGSADADDDGDEDAGLAAASSSLAGDDDSFDHGHSRPVSPSSGSDSSRLRRRRGRKEPDTPQSMAKRALDTSTDFDMFAQVPVHERRPKLEALMNELERMLELEAITRKDIEEQMKLPDQSDSESERLRENLRMSDERRDFLHHRALKCASAIISCDEELSMLSSS